MKKAIFFIYLLSVVTAFAQDKPAGRAFPKVDIKTMSGENISTATFDNDGKPIIISFWATWCKPCIEELKAISEVYDKWREETGVKVIVISVDDTRTMQRVAPFVNARGWSYESYIDPNGDLKRAMNVNMPPHTFVLNGNKEIVWQHVGFEDGNEEELYEEVKKVSVSNK